MKNILPLSVFVMSLSFLTSGCTAFGLRTVEEQAHEVILKDGNFQIRSYEPAIIAETEVTGNYGKATNQAFGIIAGYIFGKNEAREKLSDKTPVAAVQKTKKKSQKIAMTMPVHMTPVEMEGKQAKWHMSFVMPAKYTMETLPKPLDEKVNIREIEGYQVAVYRFNGYMRDSDLDKYAPQLETWLKAKGFKSVGQPWMAGYDPPWTMGFLRRNELQVKIKPVNQSEK